MKKIFQTSILQCCRPFQFKETQTDLSYLSKKHRPDLESGLKPQIKLSSHSMEFEVPLANNNSYQVEEKLKNKKGDKYGICTKCLLVNHEEGSCLDGNIPFLSTDSGRNNSRSDISLVVEVSHARSYQPLQEEECSLITDSLDPFLSCHQSYEQTLHTTFYCIGIFEYSECLVTCSIHRNNSFSALSLTQSVNRRTLSKNHIIVTQNACTYAPSHCTYTEVEESSFEPFTKLIFLKAFCTRSVQFGNYFLKSQKPIEKFKIMKPTFKVPRPNNQMLTLKSKIPSRVVHIDKGNVEDTALKVLLPIGKNQNAIKYCSLKDYKDFLLQWKMRKWKKRRFDYEKCDPHKSASPSKDNISRSNHIPTHSFMIRFINKQFKNESLSTPNHNSIGNIKRSRKADRLTVRNHIEVLSRTVANIVENHFVYALYERVSAQMAGKFWILLNIFDKSLLDFNYSRLPPTLATNVTRNRQKSLLLNEDECVMTRERSNYSTSNSIDYSESTAYDISSNQAYSEDGSLELSV